MIRDLHHSIRITPLVERPLVKLGKLVTWPFVGGLAGGIERIG
jgi:hypothetical protein